MMTTDGLNIPEFIQDQKSGLNINCYPIPILQNETILIQIEIKCERVYYKFRWRDQKPSSTWRRKTDGSSRYTDQADGKV